MNIPRMLRILLIAISIGSVGITISLARASSQQVDDDKPPEEIRGGVWSDHFYNPQLVGGVNFDVQMGHLILKFDEQLHWTQTWTAHFNSGDFFQTEAISDSVRLAPDGMGQFFTSGTFTSTVFYAGKPVDWSLTEWNFSGIPEGIEVKFRTGNTPTPDETWTAWEDPLKIFNEYMCWYTFNTDDTGCLTNMSGIDSSAFIQYRAAFLSDDPTKTVALYDIDFLYGTHTFTGTALSMIIPPVDLREWESVIITSTIPTSTTLIIDITTSDGTILAHDVQNGDDLAWIDPVENPALQLRASFSTSDKSLTPDVDVWGIQWLVLHKHYLPAIVR
jgi:hypothetical protein